jgi:hypothetical protein
LLRSQVPENGRQPERGPGEVHAHLRRCLITTSHHQPPHPVTTFSVIIRAPPLQNIYDDVPQTC